MTNQRLKDAAVYFENKCPYMKLVYEYEDEKGLHEIVYPKVEFPFDTCNVPTVYDSYTQLCPSRDGCHLYIINYTNEAQLFKGVAHIDIGGIVHTYDSVYYVDKIIKPKVHEMTVEEIEEKLGYPVKIVAKEKENKNA